MRRLVVTLVILALGFGASACARGGSGPRTITSSTPSGVPGISSSPAPPTTVSPSLLPAIFHGTVLPIDSAERASMIASSVWREGCPVAIDDLRLLTVDYWGFDGTVHAGRLVVNRDAARAVLAVMRRLFQARFPIARMQLVDVYRGDDDRSMAADNTSAFNCRGVPGSSSWSQHAYGRAVDINPVENPEIRHGVISPPAGAGYIDRSRWARGKILAGDEVVRAFASVGWRWGGYWRSLKDYMHFSANGL